MAYCGGCKGRNLGLVGCLDCDSAVVIEDEYPDTEPPPAVRTFDTGATRDNDANKLDYEGFLSPVVLERFAEYMHKNRVQADGSLRDSDNWQKGIPLEAYMKSMFRHFMDVWSAHRGYDAPDIEESLCALLFNVMGMLHEHIRNAPHSCPF